MSRRRAVNDKSAQVALPPNANGSAGGAQHGPQAAMSSVAGALLDYSLMLFLVFGGCCSYVIGFWFLRTLGAFRHCSNVWAFEELLRAEPNVGTSAVA
jgi:hypothetical protein